jgi:hypothetical protein
MRHDFIKGASVKINTGIFCDNSEQLLSNSDDRMSMRYVIVNKFT